jgi:hypothetical protein
MVLLLTALADAQNPSASKATESNVPEPELPVVEYSGIGGLDGMAQVVTKRSTIYDTWRENRKAIGQLSEGEKVNEFGGVCVTRKPDRLRVNKVDPDFTLKAGDVILQYAHWGAAKADIWASGGWHRYFDWGETDHGTKEIFYAEKDGTLLPVLQKWDLTVIEPGIREWWLRVSREDGTSGWVLVQGNLKYGYMNLLFSASLDETAGSKMSLAGADVRVPKLPVIDYSTCPGDGRIVPDWKIERDDRVYSSFQDGRTAVGALKAGEKVTVLRGANVVREPDQAVIKYIGPSDDPSLLKVGAVALGYGVEPNQYVIFWSNGVWFVEDIEMVAEKGACGFALGFAAGGCTMDIVKDGTSEWWVQVKTNGGLTGWVHGEKNFSDLCHYGED